jgi:hypothetical protein
MLITAVHAREGKRLVWGAVNTRAPTPTGFKGRERLIPTLYSSHTSLSQRYISSNDIKGKDDN